MIALFYQLISNPFSFIKTEKETSLGKMSLICIFLASACSASEANGNLSSIISLTLISMLIYAILLFAQSVTIDFFAQWILNTQAKSLPLFHWFGISLLPLTLWIPLNAFESTGKALGLVSLIKFSTLILVLSEQIAILKAQYNLNTKVSLLLYIFPFLFMIISVFILAMVIAFLG